MARKALDAPKITARIGLRFNHELESIKEIRLQRGVDQSRRSTRLLTDLITKHLSWPQIREDLIKIRLKEEVDE